MKRFSLRRLFVAATIVILLIGALQIRRRSILREAAQLRADGANFAIDLTWRDKVWIAKPDSAGIRFDRAAAGRYQIGDSEYSIDEAIAHGRRLQQRLQDFGVKRISNLHIDQRNVITSFPEIESLSYLDKER